jgi:hypothetical protein
MKTSNISNATNAPNESNELIDQMIELLAQSKSTTRGTTLITYYVPASYDS